MAEYIEAKGIDFKTEMTEAEVKETEQFLQPDTSITPQEQDSSTGITSSTETTLIDPEAPNPGDEAFVNTPSFKVETKEESWKRHAETLAKRGPRTPRTKKSNPKPNPEPEKEEPIIPTPQFVKDAVTYIEWRNKLLGDKPLSKVTASELAGMLKTERKDWADKLLASHKKILIRKGQNINKGPETSVTFEVSDDLEPEAVQELKKDVAKEPQQKTQTHIAKDEFPTTWEIIKAEIRDNWLDIVLNLLVIVLGGIAGYYTAKYVSSFFTSSVAATCANCVQA